ncbi:MAG: NAD(+) synthetase, partial [Thermoprotei archaeon]
REKLAESGAKGFIIGVSGGVDSSTTLPLLVKAVGSSRVRALILPDKHSTPKEDIEDALGLVQALNVKHDFIEINDILEAFRRSLPAYDQSKVAAEGNLKARIRMCILYYYANKLNYLVCGTGDKSEILIGYFTKYGDGGVDILPIGDLYKTQVRQLALHLGLPEKIALKPSSPRLWPGQVAEKELGLSYEEIDLVLYSIFDLRLPLEEAIEATGIPEETFRKILQMVSQTEHKRMLPLVPRLSVRTPGIDWRYPYHYKI